MAAKKKTGATAAMKSALTKFDEKFQKDYGVGTLTSSEEKPYQVIPTGSLDLDTALVVGGWVLGRLSEVWGVDAIGKTTLALQACREAQQAYPDRLVFWVDMEQTLDRPWARLHGVDLDRMRIFTPESAEDVADAVKDAVRSGLFVLVVVDSVGAMIPEAEKEKDADEAVVALQAKIVTRMVKIAAVECNKADAHLMLINQVRANVGGYGDPTTTGGGFSLKHVTSQKIRLKRSDKKFTITVEGKQVEVGHEIAIQVERNKVGPPKKRAGVVLFHTPTAKYGPAGFDRADEAATVGIRHGVIQQAGAWYTFTTTGEKVQSREKVVEALRNAPALIDDIRAKVLEQMAGDVVTGEEAEIDLSHLVEGGTGMFDGEKVES